MKETTTTVWGIFSFTDPEKPCYHGCTENLTDAQDYIKNECQKAVDLFWADRHQVVDELHHVLYGMTDKPLHYKIIGANVSFRL